MRDWHKYSLPENSVTEQYIYHSRRSFLAKAAALSLVPACGQVLANCDEPASERDLTPNSLNEISGYNNYYEFSTNKKAIRVLAQELTTEPWSVSIEGEVAKPRTYDVSDLIAKLPQ